MPIGGGGSGGGANDIQAGGAFVRIYSKDDLSKSLDRLRARFNSFGKFLNSTGNTLAAAGAGILAPITALFAGGVNRAAQVGKLAEQFGISAEQMSRFAFAAEDAGVSIEEVMMAQEKFAGAMKRAPIFDSRTARDALETQRGLKDAWVALQAALAPLVQVIVPLVQGFAAFVKQNAQLVFIAAAAGAGLIALGIAAKAVAIGIALCTAAMTALKFAALFLTPEGILLAGIAALTIALAKDSQAARDLGGAFREMGRIGMDAWGSIVKALKRGDLESAMEVSVKAIEAMWLGLIVKMGTHWREFIRTVRASMHIAASVASAGMIPFGPGAGASWMTGSTSTMIADAMADLEARVAADRARKALRDAMAASDAKGRLETEIPSVHGRLNAAYVKGAFQGPLGQQLGIGDQFQRKLLENTGKAAGLLGMIYEAMEAGGAKFT